MAGMGGDRKKKDMPMISIVIPVYRTEAYLKECVKTALEQDYEKLEIILVDDGSPDGCPALCDCLAGQNRKIKVIHQENQGLGAARNTGLEKAQGDYVLFLDSDDCLNQSNTVRKLMEAALNRQADIITGNFRRFQGDRYGPVNRHHLKEGSYTNTVDFRFRGFLTDGHLIMDWGKLYRKDFLLRNQLWCERQIHMEDKLRNMMCCSCEPKYAFVDDCVYLYRITEGSITQQYRKNPGNLKRDWIYVSEFFNRFLKEHKRLEQFGDLLAFHVFCGIFTIGRQSLHEGKEKAVEILREYGKNSLVHRTLFSMARGRYLKGVRSLIWRVLLQSTSALFCLRAYKLIIWGIILLQDFGTEKKGSKLQDAGGETYLGKRFGKK